MCVSNWAICAAFADFLFWDWCDESCSREKQKLEAELGCINNARVYACKPSRYLCNSQDSENREANAKFEEVYDLRTVNIRRQSYTKAQRTQTLLL